MASFNSYVSLPDLDSIDSQNFPYFPHGLFRSIVWLNWCWKSISTPPVFLEARSAKLGDPDRSYPANSHRFDVRNSSFVDDVPREIMAFPYLCKCLSQTCLSQNIFMTRLHPPTVGETYKYWCGKAMGIFPQNDPHSWWLFHIEMFTKQEGLSKKLDVIYVITSSATWLWYYGTIMHKKNTSPGAKSL
jgi:hypothetical protein